MRPGSIPIIIPNHVYDISLDVRVGGGWVVPPAFVAAPHASAPLSAQAGGSSLGGPASHPPRRPAPAPPPHTHTHTPAVEPSGGRIVIDSVDTSSIGLFDLRSRLALVPQVGGRASPRHSRGGVGWWADVRGGAPTSASHTHSHTLTHPGRRGLSRRQPLGGREIPPDRCRTPAASQPYGHPTHTASQLTASGTRTPLDLPARLPACLPPWQDPVVFSGSIRSNLDPFGDAGGDDRIWGALAQVCGGCRGHLAVRDVMPGLCDGGGSVAAVLVCIMRGRRGCICMGGGGCMGHASSRRRMHGALSRLPHSTPKAVGTLSFFLSSLFFT